MRKIGVLGSGSVSKILAEGFLAKGWLVKRGTRDAAKLAAWQDAAGPRASVGDFAETAAYGEIVVLAVKGSAAEACVGAAADGLSGKLVLDVTNPIADGPPPADGILRYFTSIDESLMERLQKRVPAARFVKAFSSVGGAYMVNPDFGGVKPTMFICGDSVEAKQECVEILGKFGWEACDVGGAVGARAIEPLCQLWCAPGFLRGQWSHAFKLLVK
jgi:predicted dinucleotide-binding enzyme